MPQTFTQYLDEIEKKNNPQKDYITESSLSRLWRKYKECDSGTISACRGEMTPEENDARTKKLKDYLLNLGYSVTAVKGYYIENYGTPKERPVEEKSFIVFDQFKTGKLKKDLIRMGKHFNQDSITFNSVKDGNYYLIGTSPTCEYPKFGEEVKLGKPMFGKDGEFHSRIRNRPFVFEAPSEKVEEYYDYYDLKLSDHNISRIRSILALPDIE